MTGRPAAPPLRVMFDSNGYDAILAHGDGERLRGLIAAGRIEIVTTHIQEDELRQTPRKSEREALLNLYFFLQKKRTPTSVALWGISTWGQAKWGNDTSEEKLSAIQRNKPAASRDEIIGLTAKDHCDIFVTEDRKFAARLAEAGQGFRVMDYPAFREILLRNS